MNMTDSDDFPNLENLKEKRKHIRGIRIGKSDIDYHRQLVEYIKDLSDTYRNEHLVDPLHDDNQAYGAVLTRDLIKEYANRINLIEPFDETNLRTAHYRLTVGDKYRIEDEVHILEQDEKFTIDPFSVAVIQTHEIINMPYYLIGRWNIKVSEAYKGLLWVGGPQVDPGYTGHLFCPIYNLSSEPQEIESGQQIAVLDFIKTTDFPEDEINTELDMTKPKQDSDLSIEDFPSLESALVSEAAQKIDRNEQEIEDLRNNVEEDISSLRTHTVAALGIVLTLVGILFAALAIIVSSSVSDGSNIPIVPTINQSMSLLFAVISLGISSGVALYVYFRTRDLKKRFDSQN